MLFPSKSLIKQLHVRTSKTYGQNFLVDKNIAAKIFTSADTSPHDFVIEIGPGLGSLTFFLAEHHIPAIAFEIDRRFFQYLHDVLPGDSSVRVENKDILSIRFADYTVTNHRAILLGSIPYSITSPIILKVLEESACIKRAIFVLQKEVAQRLCASPGNKEYGVLSVYCSAYADTSLLASVPPQCFYPKPKVDSAVIKLEPLVAKKWADKDEILFRRIIKASFTQRRKTLYNNLKDGIAGEKIEPEQLKKKCLACGIDVMRRAETFSVNEFYTLTDVIKKL